MKKLLILFLILIVACAVPENVPVAEQGLDELEGPIDVPNEGVFEVPIDAELSMFSFEGYAPGKSHIGSFEDMEGVLIYENGIIIGARGIIQASSVNTGIDGLDAHLQRDDFFDVAVYPEITFNSVKIENNVMSGKLTFRGVSEIIFQQRTHK